MSQTYPNGQTFPPFDLGDHVVSADGTNCLPFATNTTMPIGTYTATMTAGGVSKTVTYTVTVQ